MSHTKLEFVNLPISVEDLFYNFDEVTRWKQCGSVREGRKEVRVRLTLISKKKNYLYRLDVTNLHKRDTYFT